MTRFVVPNLQIKFQILIERGVVSDKKEIALKLDVSRKTLDGWAHGSDRWTPGAIPKKRQDDLIDLFANCFPASTERTRVVQALQQSGAEFEAAIERTNAISFDDLLATHAVSDKGRLLTRKENGNVSLVEIEAEADSSRKKIKRGQWFRIEFDRSTEGDIIIAFQATAGMTASLPASLNETSTKLVIPPLKLDGTLPHMRERTHLGPHDFVALQIATPLPCTLHEALTTKKLIQPDALHQLTAHLIDLPRSAWRLFILKITVDDTDGEMGDD